MSPNLIVLYHPHSNVDALLQLAQHHQAILCHQTILSHGLMLIIPEHRLQQAERDFWQTQGVMLVSQDAARAASPLGN